VSPVFSENDCSLRAQRLCGEYLVAALPPQVKFLGLRDGKLSQERVLLTEQDQQIEKQIAPATAASADHRLRFWRAAPEGT
jgi:hypothetical protein